MRILVLTKQVCDGADTISPDDSARWVTWGPHCVFRMNRYDEYALEEALRIRERIPGAEVHALSLGPERVEAVVRRALGMGADHGIHVAFGGHGYTSPRERARLIAGVAEKKGYDLVLAGVMAEDDMEGQVGGLVAQTLGYRCATSVIFEETDPGAGEVFVQREIEDGRREGFTLKLPAVLTVQSGINVPRYPVLSHMLRAKTAVLEKVEPRALAPAAGTLVKIVPAETGGPGEFLEGSPAQKAGRLLEILHENSLL